MCWDRCAAVGVVVLLQLVARPARVLKGPAIGKPRRTAPRPGQRVSSAAGVSASQDLKGRDYEGYLLGYDAT
jgi:hypothetical protein